MKAPGLQQLPVYLRQQQGKAQGVVLTHLQHSPHLGGNVHVAQHESFR